MPVDVITDLAFLGFFAFLAGYIDSVAGGGGLIQVPALLVGLQNESVATLFGTNKFSSVFGTLNATIKYATKVALPWKYLGVGTFFAFVFSLAGAGIVSALSKDLVRPVVLVLLICVVLYTVFRPNFGLHSGTILSGRKSLVLATISGALMGFYDGFFGPGTGTFLIVIFIGVFGLNFLQASACSKIINLVTNIGALCYFLPNGNVLFTTGICMAACNMTGAYFGARAALKHGSGFVRKFFIGISSILIIKIAIDTFMN